ncbi:ThuA domain-containing protein [Verrucomicrobiales bacterium]|nr:ThuA domain-containing protein [Verrucomicrobiales bacterium]
MRLLILLSLLIASPSLAKDSIRALIIDGRNNHDWRATTDYLRATLDSTGRFDVTVSTAPQLEFPRVPHRASRPEDEADYQEAKKQFEAPLATAREALRPRWEAWMPDFSTADLVILNYNGEDWPKDMQAAFLNFVKEGGGVVLVHGANNPFRNWIEFNEMIGLGWRPSPVGRAIKIDPDTGKSYAAKDPDLPNKGNSGHGSKHAFAITVRASDHPIMRDLPAVWMHASDELYHNMRGPAKNLTVLSSAFSDPKQRGTGLHEPITSEVAYGKGRVIVTSMGHLWPGDLARTTATALQCVGFQTVFARSCEYVATGKTTLPVPENFPGPDKATTASAHSITWPDHETSTEGAALQSMQKKRSENPYCLLTPEEEKATFELAEGYEIELFASEPMVEEPVLTVWDSDGAMYVAEMRSYMQNVEGKGTKTMKNGRIKRLVDTDGDGRADKATIFVDELNLPRAILPLADGWIAVRETDTYEVTAWRDTDNDGIADENKVLYDPGDSKKISSEKSVEHQDSGLVWNLDNHIYITYNSERYRYTNGEWIAEKQPGHWTQWGLTHDDVGDLYWITNSEPLVSAYIHPRYWDIPRKIATEPVPRIPVVLPEHYTPTFLAAYSSCLFNDRGGEASATRNFTSACGQSIYRGDKFPVDARGDYFFCDPTIHVVRRAKISKEGAMLQISKADSEGQEFLRSSDINSRFINTAEGPDGCLYVTDMYRGIIQDAPWLNPQARENIQKNGLDQNIQHGRIWRIRHRDFKPEKSTDLPAISKESTIALIRHLESNSGWYRDTAQREILLREDRESIAPHLAMLARFSQNPLGRLHTLWTLHGIEKADLAILSHLASDRDPRIRRAVVQIGEPLLADDAAFEAIARPLATDGDPEVAKQLILSLGLVRDHPDAVEVIQEVCRRHKSIAGVQFAATLSLWGMKDLPLIQEIHSGKGFDAATAQLWKNSLGNWDRGLKFRNDMPDAEQRRITGGETIYFKNCVSCHGVDGKGISIPGTETSLAPSLVDSARVKGNPRQLVPIFFHGLTGPIDGKTYQAGFMAPAQTFGIVREDRLSELITYIRFVHGDGASSVSHEEVKSIQREFKDRAAPWTDAELDAVE